MNFLFFTAHPLEPVLAFNSEQAVTFVSRADGRVLTSFGHAGWSLKGVTASDGEWLLWVQSREGVDQLFLADGAELGGIKVPRLRPIVSAMSTAFAAPTCVFEDGELRPARFMLDPLLR